MRPRLAAAHAQCVHAAAGILPVGIAHSGVGVAGVGAVSVVGVDALPGAGGMRHQRALYSRLARHVPLPVWTPTECGQYLLRGLDAVGLSPGALEPAASELLASASGGVPRSLCLLARAAWIQAATQPTQRITPEHVQAAIQTVPCVPGLLQPPSAPAAELHP